MPRERRTGRERLAPHVAVFLQESIAENGISVVAFNLRIAGSTIYRAAARDWVTPATIAAIHSGLERRGFRVALRD